MTHSSFVDMYGDIQVPEDAVLRVLSFEEMRTRYPDLYKGESIDVPYTYVDKMDTLKNVLLPPDAYNIVNGYVQIFRRVIKDMFDESIWKQFDTYGWHISMFDIMSRYTKEDLGW